MKDLILITAYCPTTEQIDSLEKCVDSVIKTGYHILLISHTHVPSHIQKKCQYYFYDYLNETSEDYNLLGHTSFEGDDFIIQSRFFQKSFYGFAIYRMFSLASQVAINFGYEKLHHIEYDCELLDKSIIEKNSSDLEIYDSVFYTNDGTSEGFLFGSFKSFKVNSLPEHFRRYDKKFIESEMKKIEPKQLEFFTKKLFMDSGNVLFKNNKDLYEESFRRGPNFYSKGYHYTLYFDAKDNTLNIFYLSMKPNEENIVVIVNYDKIVRFKAIPNKWHIRTLGFLDEVTNVRIDNSDKCLYEKSFDNDFKEIFINKSYITHYEKNN